MPFKFYYDIISQPSRAVYIFLKINNLPFEKKIIKVAKGQNVTKEFMKINPLSLVPVIEDNGFILRESVGILRYLCHEKGLADHWYPSERRAQAKVDEFLEWQHLGLRIPLAMYFAVTYMEPLLTGKDPLQSDIDRYEKAMLEGCNKMENIWLDGNSKYLFGNHLSIADLLAAMEIEQPRISGYDPRDGRPKLTAYMDHVRTEMNPHYDEACKLLNSLCPK